MSNIKSTIRPLLYEDLGDFWDIVVLSGSEGYYPNAKAGRIEWFNKLMTELPSFSYYGAYRDEKMVGGMAISDFELNVRSKMIRLSSIGMVHTDMLHKKEKICKDMIEYFIESNRQKGINMLTLTPFRPDFYKHMGFGYGSCVYNYRIPPLSFPDNGSKEYLVYMDESEKQEFLECLSRVSRITHGAVRPFWLLGAFESGKRILVYKACDIIRGGLVFSFGQFRELVIEDMFYENVEVFNAFCSFLHSQSDQFDRILFSTPDEYFYYILHDPTDGIGKNECYTSTINNMFRVIDVAGLFGELSDVNFNNKNAVLEISIIDSFCPLNSGVTIVEFIDGKAFVCSLNSHTSSKSIKMKLDIADFSSLIIGAINIKALYRLGLLEISDTDNLELLESIFTIGQKPLSFGGL